MQSHAPLNALRAFEAAARTGSFTSAAHELGVSSAAVSQQVKVLEDYWGKTLFFRQGNRIALTDAGLTAYPPVGQCMSGLAELSDKMRHTTQRQRFVLSAPQSVAETWLAPRLAMLDRDALAMPIDIRVEDDPVDLVRHQIDMRLFYGHDLYGDYRVDTLFSDQLIAVAAPTFLLANGAGLAGLEDRYLIHTDWGSDYSSSPSWSAALGDQRLVDQAAGIRVQASSTAIRFALQGFGVALVPAAMVQQQLSSKRLSQLPLPAEVMAHDYLAAYPKRLSASPVIKSVVKVLQG